MARKGMRWEEGEAGGSGMGWHLREVAAFPTLTSRALDSAP